MSYTTTLIDQFKTLKNVESDFAAAKALGVTHATLSNYRNGVSHADDRIAIVLADAIGLDRLRTIARINSERAKKPEDRAFWKRIATAAALLLAVYTAGSTGRAMGAEAEHGFTKSGPSMHCARFWSWLRLLARSLMALGLAGRITPYGRAAVC